MIGLKKSFFNKNMRVARVVPLRSLPRGKELYDYSVPDHLSTLRVHELVEVPFRNRPLLSLVWSIEEVSESPYTLRDVLGIIDRRIHIDERQHELIDWVIQHYGGSRTQFLLPLWTAQKELIIPSAWPTVASERNNRIERCVLHCDEAFNLIAERVEHADGQIFILCPTIETVRTITQRLQTLNRGTILEFHSQLTNRLRHEQTRIVVNNLQCVVVGTKLGIFLPWQHLRSIILTDAWSSDYKHWDQEPRYDARVIAERLSQLHGCPLITTSPVQTLEQWHDNPLVNIESAVRVEHCAANLYLQNAEQEPLLFPLLENTQQQKETILLLAPQRAHSSIAYCQDCQQAYRCITCERLLSQEVASPVLVCTFCGQSKQTERCRSCNGTRIRVSVNKFERFIRDVHSAFPKLSIEHSLLRLTARVDEGALLVNNETAIDQLNAQRWQNNKTQQLNTILWWEPEQWLGAHQYRQREEQFLFLSMLKDLASTQQMCGVYVCGTLSPTLATTMRDPNATQSFYDQELKDRARFLYPPYRRLIRVDLHTKKQETSPSEEHRIMDTIRNQISDIVLEPTGNNQIRRRGYRFRQEWILKIPPAQMETTRQKLFDILPSSWSIDVDPQ